MLYIGHFSFDELDSEHENEIRHGYFTCLVDTDNAERAANEFKKVILSLKKTKELFSRISAVYIEDIIELSHIPQTAIVTRIQSSAGQFPESITHSLPGTTSPGINIYGFAPDVRDTETAESQGEYKASQPFIEF